MRHSKLTKVLTDHADECFKRLFKEFLHIFVNLFQNINGKYFNSFHQKFKLFN